MPGGRPTTYNQTIADALCEAIANGSSIRKICLGDDMPAMSTVFRWLTLIPEFSEQYARAKEEQAETFADEIVDIADEAQTTVKEHDGFTEVTYDSVAVARNRLRIDARKWVAAKLKPKKYGDKLDLAGDLNHNLLISEVVRKVID